MRCHEARSRGRAVRMSCVYMQQGTKRMHASMASIRLSSRQEGTATAHAVEWHRAAGDGDETCGLTEGGRWMGGWGVVASKPTVRSSGRASRPSTFPSSHALQWPIDERTRCFQHPSTGRVYSCHRPPAQQRAHRTRAWRLWGGVGCGRRGAWCRPASGRRWHPTIHGGVAGGDLRAHGRG